MKKVVGYILAAVGLAGLATSTIPAVENKVFGMLSPGLADGLGISLLVGSLIVLGVGVVILFVSEKSSAGQKKKEVPIYKGKEIIGYRQSD